MAIFAGIEVDTTVEVDIDIVEAFNGLDDDDKAKFLTEIKHPNESANKVNLIYDAYRNKASDQVDKLLNELFWDVLGRMA